MFAPESTTPTRCPAVTLTRPASSAASAQAPLGSATTFRRSNSSRIAVTISASETVTTASTRSEMIDQIAAMGVPIFVFTGGDPMKRKDVFELIRYAADKGVQVALTPSATPLLTREAIFKLKEAGLVRLGISLDG